MTQWRMHDTHEHNYFADDEMTAASRIGTSYTLYDEFTRLHVNQLNKSTILQHRSLLTF